MVSILIFIATGNYAMETVIVSVLVLRQIFGLILEHSYFLVFACMQLCSALPMNFRENQRC